MDEAEFGRTVEVEDWWEKRVWAEWREMRAEIDDFHKLDTTQQLVFRELFESGMEAGRAIVLERIAEVI